MRTVFILGLAGAAMLVTGTALADGTGQQASAQQNDPSKIVCKQQEASTGSRFTPPPVCRTKAEWDQMERDAQQNLDRAQRIRTTPQ